METILNIDRNIVLWLNKWAGKYYILDNSVGWVVGDYFVPVCIGLLLFATWFFGKDTSDRTTYQFAVLKALISVGFANLAVLILNQFYFRERPFMDLDLAVLFYYPTDSSFPANPAVVAFSVAASIWQRDRSLGMLVVSLAILWCICRIYAGVFYPTDIIGGALIGIIVSYMVRKIFPLTEPIPTIVLKTLRRVYVA